MSSVPTAPATYLLQAAERFGFTDIIYPERQDRIVAKLSPADLAALSATYRQLVADGTHHDVTRWIQKNYPDDTARNLMMLLNLFELLYDRGVAPFAELRLGYHPEMLGGPDELPAGVLEILELGSIFPDMEDADEMDEVIVNLTPEGRQVIEQLRRKISEQWKLLAQVAGNNRVTGVTKRRITSLMRLADSA